MKVEWAPLAIDRVAEIAAYIAEDNPSAAEKWIRNIFVRVGQLRQFPRSGRAIPETTRKDIRELIWGNYRIIYRITARRVAILTVRHTKTILPLAELD
ncbi:MAG TPA: type II toxin-antitoxin system RelE/ParE family toxin [Kiritimatiellia bacterium]|jgi:plasmid stabilization system protein ParE|nr:MAG: Plasmid stabilization system protein [Verrucomicrobia bacterium ADurb.Bin018]HOE00241.1 type II toxin-antitoxin system RelE/ParE family toxin [Kiritimatiellia bacterium]HOE37115.1 type II toxin-antitoxin system RelE/ParE family toxin [Kiritimatiellia bacterium]HOR74504.1 type II toxin-antitoxin system RelE/ParE family toxin [Kiritimatiellia bacterium]HPK69476.1 type II toxin-antitoxin system RelE/ParE family toxin [Kiritimatiellia bacterium]